MELRIFNYYINIEVYSNTPSKKILKELGDSALLGKIYLVRTIKKYYDISILDAKLITDPILSYNDVKDCYDYYVYPHSVQFNMHFIRNLKKYPKINK
jgi:hypothetical protein